MNDGGKNTNESMKTKHEVKMIEKKDNKSKMES